MAFEWIDDDAEVVRMRLTGLFSGEDLAAIQRGVVKAIAQHGRVRGLIILENFEGWSAGENWGDLTFQEQHDADIERIAFVGDEQWRDEMLAFMTAPFRAAEIRYFAPHELDRANAWLVG